MNRYSYRHDPPSCGGAGNRGLPGARRDARLLENVVFGTGWWKSRSSTRGATVSAHRRLSPPRRARANRTTVTGLLACLLGIVGPSCSSSDCPVCPEAFSLVTYCRNSGSCSIDGVPVGNCGLNCSLDRLKPGEVLRIDIGSIRSTLGTRNDVLVRSSSAGVTDSAEVIVDGNRRYDCTIDPSRALCRGASVPTTVEVRYPNGSKTFPYVYLVDSECSEQPGSCAL